LEKFSRSDARNSSSSGREVFCGQIVAKLAPAVVAAEPFQDRKQPPARAFLARPNAYLKRGVGGA